MSDTSLLEHVETSTTTQPGNGDGDHERFAHYVTHADLERAMFDGIPATALCGKKWLPTKDPKRFPVCPECKAAWEQKDPDE